MQQRNRNGDLWFSHKMVHPETGETVYCRGYASASSPGYDILLPAAELSQSSEKPAAAQQTAVTSTNGQPNIQQATPKGKHTNGSGNGRIVYKPPAISATQPQQNAALNTALFGQRP
jgi:hypothetical protein